MIRSKYTCSYSRNETPSPAAFTSKKAKKNALKNAQANASNYVDSNEQAALNRRAQRFQREHEIERQKNTGGGFGNGFKNNNNNSHLFNQRSTSGSPAPWGANGYDDPEADPVCS